MHGLLTWLHYHAGLDDGSGSWYLFWSGIGSGGPWLVAMGTILKLSNCHAHGCWRPGFHPTAAGHRTCKRHHPTGGLTADHIAAAHHAAAGTSPVD